MADDIQSNIRVNVDTSSALSNLKNLQRQLSAFHTSMAKGSAQNALAAKQQQKSLMDTINASGKFAAQIKTVSTTTESFTRALETNKLSLGQYFKYAGGASKSFGRLFTNEFNTIEKVARERVKSLQTQYIKLGRDANGALKAISVRPLALDMESLATKTAMAAQKQQLLNQLLKQGSTNLLNFGKNTQWAGRQLMVGFTIPLGIMASTAGKAFMQMEEQAIRFRRVYGDLMTPGEETEGMLDTIKKLASEFTKYGVAVSDTMALAADAAAMGKKGADLTAQVFEATRLAVLGQVEQGEALKTTIAVTNAFGTAANKLAGKIDFLNAVENQTVTSIEDLTIAIPKAGPVVQQLGGDVEDLAFFLTAMKEGGINASEGANALKSGLASLINPTEKASTMLAGYGINIKNIVESNKGNVAGVVVDFAKALDTLDPLARARAIEQLFGKFQFSRLSTLFQNVIAEGTQASKVLELAGATSSDLARLSAKELNKVAQSPMYKFKKAIEDIKKALAPVGEMFLTIATPFIEFGTKVLEAFNKLDERTKKFIGGLIAVVGGLGPVLIMSFGLLMNGVAQAIKGFTFIKGLFNRTSVASQDLGSQIDYMTTQQLEAAAVAASLEQTHSKLTQTFTSEAGAVDLLRMAYERAVGAQAAFNTPGIQRTRPAAKLATGIISVPGTGNQDTEPAMLTPGEAVIPADKAKKYRPLLQAIMAGTIPGFKKGKDGESGSVVKVQGPRARISEMAHFAPATKMTGQELVDWSMTQPVSVQAKVKKVLDDQLQFFENEQKMLESEFDVYNNEVINLTAWINNKLGRSGLKNPNARVSAGVLKTEFGSSREQAHGPMAAQLEADGVASDKIQQIMTSLADAVDESLAMLGDAVEVSGDDLDKLLQEVYNKVAEDSPELAAAKKKMAQPGGLLKPDGSASPTRLGFTTDDSPTPFYKGRGQEFKEAGARYSEADPRWIEKTSINFKAQTESQARMYKEAFQALMNANEDAAVQVMNTPPQQRLAALREAAAKYGIEFSDAIFDGVEQGFDVATQRNSPPQKALDAGEDYGDALNTGAQSKVDDAEVVGQQLGQAILPEGRQSNRVPRRAVRIGDLEQRQEQQQRVAASQLLYSQVIAEGTQGLEGFNAKLRNASYGLTSIAGIASMLGGDFAEASNGLFQFGMAASGLTTVIDMLSKANLLNISYVSASTQAKAAEAAASVLATGADSAEAAASTAAATADTVEAVASSAAAAADTAEAVASGGKVLSGGISKIGELLKGLVTFGGRIGTLTMSVGRLFGIVGLVITAIGGLIWIVNAVSEAKKKEKAEIEGLGNTAKLTADKLKFLEEVLGEAPTANALDKFTGFKSGGTNQEAATADQRARVTKITEDSRFQELYGDSIGQLQVADEATAKSMLTALAVNLKGANVSDTGIQDLLMAIREAAGKEGIVITPESIDLNLEGSRKDLKKSAVNLGKEFSKAIKGSNFGKRTQESIQGPLDNSSAGFKTVIDKNLGKDAKAKLNAFAGNLEGVINGAVGAFKNGQIEGKVFAKTFDDVNAAILSIENPEAQLAAFDALLTSMNPKLGEQATNIANVGDKNLLLQMAMLGITDISPAYITALENQTNSQYDAAEAARVRAIMEGQVAAAIASQVEVNKNGAPTPPENSGGGEKSPYEKAIDQLKGQKKELSNAANAYSKLTKAGLSAAQAFEIAKDPILAAAVAGSDVKTQKWKDLLALLKKVNAEAAKAHVKDLITELNTELKLKKDFTAIMPMLSKFGLSLEQMQDILNDPVLAQQLINDLKDGKLNSKDIAKYINSLKNKTVEIDFLMKTPEGREQLFNQGYDNAEQYFSAQEQKLQLAYDKANKADLDLIQSKESEIAKLNYQMDDWDASLSEIGLKEDAINDKYDKQSEALDRLNQAQTYLNNQKRRELSIAQAISSGDMAAVARAEEEAAAQASEDAFAQRQAAIEKARETELANVRDSKGNTREKAEKEIRDIQKEIFDIEEKSLEPAQERIRLAEEKLEKDKESLTFVGKTRTEWDTMKNSIDVAKTSTYDFEQQARTALNVVQSIVDAWNSLDNVSADPGEISVVTTKKSGTTTKKKTTPARTTKKATTQRKTPRFNPGTFAAGGNVSGPGTGKSDSIPAWLSNGEYVINADAVNSVGVGFLDFLNAKKFAKGGKATKSKTSMSSFNDGGVGVAIGKIVDALYQNTLGKGLSALTRKGDVSKFSAEDSAMVAMNMLPFGKVKGAQKSAIKLSDILKRPVGQPINPSFLNKFGSLPKTDLVTPKTQMMPLSEILKVQSKEFGVPAGKLSSKYWVEKGLMSAEKMQALKNSIAKNGIQSPLQLDKVRMQDVLLNGNHRVAIAKELGIKNIPVKYSMGGMVSPKYFADGGLASGTDTIPAMLSPGEFVINAQAASDFGVGNLRAINSGNYSPGNSGSNVVSTNNLNSVYNNNYSVNVSVSSNASPDQIANTVIAQIRQIDSQRLRGTRV